MGGQLLLGQGGCTVCFEVELALMAGGASTRFSHCATICWRFFLLEPCPVRLVLGTNVKRSRHCFITFHGDPRFLGLGTWRMNTEFPEAGSCDVLKELIYTNRWRSLAVHKPGTRIAQAT